MNQRNDDIAAQSGAYALNALTEEERAAFEAHLAKSAETRAETTELSDTAVALGMATDPVTPGPERKANLMAIIAQTRQLPREIDTAGEARALKTTGSPAETRAQRRWFSRASTALAAAAAAVALIVTGGLVVNSITRTSLEQTGFASQQADQLAAINAASDSQKLVSAVTGGATATFVWSEQLGTSAVIVSGLEPLPGHQVYELWYIDSAGARPSGLMDASETGTTWRVLDGTMARGDTVGITIEPTGGSDAPTTDPIVVFEST